MDYELKLLVLKKEFQKMERCFKILELCYHNGEFIDTQEDKEVVSEIITRTLSALNELIAVLKNGLALADEHEAITPEILERLSDAIIESGLNVRFSTHARLEKRYNYNLFKKMYDAGFRNIWWGLETANPRGQRLINKGIDLNAVPQILEDANRAGIMNSILCVVCFPLVTYEEDMDTYKFLKQYSEYVQCFVFHKFSLTKFSRVYMDFEKYKITIPEDTSKSRVSLYYSFKKKEGMNDLEESKIIDQFYQYYRYDKTNYFFSPDYNLLYISKYGLKWMKKKLIKKEKNKIFFKKFFSNFSLRRK